MYRGDFSVITSVLTVSEVLVYPLRAGNTILAQQYRDILFNSQGLTTIEVLPDIAENAPKFITIRKNDKILIKFCSY